MSLKKKTKAPVTRVMRSIENDDEFIELVVRFAWADRITFEEIEERLGLSESDVIALMKRHQSPQTFRRWRERVSGRATKHRRRFEDGRRRRTRVTDALK